MKRNYIILILAILLLTGGYYYFADKVFKANHKKIVKLDKKIKVARQELNSCIVQAEKLGEFTTILNHTLTKDNEFSSNEIHEMIYTMDKLAQSLGIDLSEIDHKDIFTKSKQLEHEFSFVFSTTYVKLGRLMSELEKMDYLTVIKNFEIEPEKKVVKKSKKVTEVEDIEKKYSVNLSISFIKHKMR